MAQMFNDENFEKEVLKSDIPVLVDFFAEWCGPCKMMGPVIEKLAEEYEGKWKIGKMDVDQSPKTSMEYSVQSIPTLLFFKDGKVVNMSVGFQAKEKIVAKLV
jgi:thioredoxin 1